MRALALILVVACGDNAPPPRVLAFTRTNGYRHADSIAAALDVLPGQLALDGLALDATEDPAAFTPANLAHYRAVLFLYTSGNDVLDTEGKIALEAFVRSGGGWFGLHSATDTEYDWPFYQQLVVSAFADHPAIQPAVVTIEDRAAMPFAPSPWPAIDEWYNFRSNPRAHAHVLATVDEATYTGGTMGADHPIAWQHDDLGGRALYLAPGHVADRWHEPAFVATVAAAIQSVSSNR